jgi:hypothetical protein
METSVKEKVTTATIIVSLSPGEGEIRGAGSFQIKLHRPNPSILPSPSGEKARSVQVANDWLGLPTGESGIFGA